MRTGLRLIFALLVMSGCASVPSESNQPPEAFIYSITPATVDEGELVTLSGGGTDEDGEVVAYRWRSDRDGQLSVAPEFTTSLLSAGRHFIHFAAQDNSGDWSAEVQGTVTVIARPEPVAIVAFSASPATIRAGDIVTLSWSVTNAVSVGIDQGTGTVPQSGSVTVSPEVTTTFRLTATGDNSTATAVVTVVVEPVQVVVLAPDVDMSGYVRFSGYAPYGEVYVGDDEANRGIRGFITYNISSIPSDATITRVSVDMSGYESPYDVPFYGLGCLSAFEHHYNTLQGEYRMPGLPGALEQWCALVELDNPADSTGFLDALQARLGESRFQFRLQFAEKISDGDDVRDLLRWRGPGMPTLTVEYRPGAS